MLLIALTLCLSLSTGNVPDRAGAKWQTVREMVTTDSFSRERLGAWTLDSEPVIRRVALLRIAERDATGYEMRIIGCLDDPIWSVRRQACMTLMAVGTERCRVRLEACASHDDNRAVRTRAIMALGRLADSRSFSVIYDLLGSPDFDVRGTAAAEIAHFTGIVPAHAGNVSAHAGNVSAHAGNVSAHDRPEVADRLVTLATSDPTEYVRFRARDSARAFGKAFPEAAIEPPPANYRPLLAAFLMFILALACRKGRWIVATALFLALGLVIAPIVTPANGFFATHPRQLHIRIDPRLDSLAIMKQDDPVQTQPSRKFVEDLIASLSAAGISPDTRIDFFNGLAAFRDAARNQLNAQAVIDAFSEPSGPRIVFLTAEDLFQEPFHNTQGLSTPDASILSGKRIDPVFLGEGTGDEADRKIFKERFTKLFIHEIGHMYGLAHCTTPRCVMTAIELPEQYFLLDAEYCDTCRAKLLGRM